MTEPDAPRRRYTRDSVRRAAERRAEAAHQPSEGDDDEVPVRYPASGILPNAGSLFGPNGPTPMRMDFPDLRGEGSLYDLQRKASESAQQTAAVLSQMKADADRAARRNRVITVLNVGLAFVSCIAAVVAIFVTAS